VVPATRAASIRAAWASAKAGKMPPWKAQQAAQVARPAQWVADPDLLLDIPAMMHKALGPPRTFTPPDPAKPASYRLPQDPPPAAAKS
jgi:hypothetical protein